MIYCHHCIPHPRYWLQVETLMAHQCAIQIAQCCITCILINGRSTRVYQWKQCIASKANSIRKSPQLTVTFCHCTHCKFISFECYFCPLLYHLWPIKVNLHKLSVSLHMTNKQWYLWTNKWKAISYIFYFENSIYWTNTHTHPHTHEGNTCVWHKKYLNKLCTSEPFLVL